MASRNVLSCMRGVLRDWQSLQGTLERRLTRAHRVIRRSPEDRLNPEPRSSIEAVPVSIRIGLELIDFQGMRRIFRQRRSEFWVALITLLTVVVVGVEEGIILAIVLSLIEHTRHGYRPKNMLLTPASSGTWRAEPLATGSQVLPGLMVYRFTHSIYYANAQQFSE